MKLNADNGENSIDEINNSVLRKQRERHLRKKRKKLNRIKSLLKIIFIALLIILGYELITLPQWYLASDVFSKPDAKAVRIINNEILPDKVIYDSLKNIKVQKKPIFLMSVNPIKRELFKIPAVKKVYVRRFGFPARVQIILRERTPVAVLKTALNAKPIAFSTSDGIFITNKNYMPLVETKPVLKIIIKSPDIKDWDGKRIENIRKIVKSVETYSSEKVQYVDMRDVNDVYVKIESTNIRLGVLDSTVYERIKRIYTILPQINNMNSQIKYIDLSWDKVNYLKLDNDKKDE